MKVEIHVKENGRMVVKHLELHTREDAENYLNNYHNRPKSEKTDDTLQIHDDTKRLKKDKFYLFNRRPIIED